MISHPIKDLLSQRIYGLCQGYGDHNDHDLWRTDPLLGIVCGREGDADPLAGKSTLNRLELGRGKTSETEPDAEDLGLRAPLLRPWRNGKPHQGTATLPFRRPQQFPGSTSALSTT